MSAWLLCDNRDRRCYSLDPDHQDRGLQRQQPPRMHTEMAGCRGRLFFFFFFLWLNNNSYHSQATSGSVEKKHALFTTTIRRDKLPDTPDVKETCVSSKPFPLRLHNVSQFNHRRELWFCQILKCHGD